MSVESASSIQKVDSDDSIVARSRDAADFFDSILQVQTCPGGHAYRLGYEAHSSSPKTRPLARWPRKSDPGPCFVI
jgi:hypothetical protein